MEHLNRIELRGNIGNVRINSIADRKVARLQVATNHFYKDAQGCPIIETTWHLVSVDDGRISGDISNLQRGIPVHVTGRMRNQRYTASDGTDKLIQEVVADKVELLEQ